MDNREVEMILLEFPKLPASDKKTDKVHNQNTEIQVPRHTLNRSPGKTRAMRREREHDLENFLQSQNILLVNVIVNLLKE